MLPNPLFNPRDHQVAHSIQISIRSLRSSSKRITRDSRPTARCRHRQRLIQKEFSNSNSPHLNRHLRSNLTRRYIENSLVLSRLTNLCPSKRIYISRFCSFKGPQGLPKIMLLLAPTPKSRPHTSKQMMHRVRWLKLTQKWMMLSQ